MIALASPKNESFLKELGADDVVDYKRDDLTEVIQEADAAFDSMATSAQLFKMLKKGGRYVSITAKPSAELAESYGVAATNFLFHSDARQLAQIADLIEKGIVRVIMDKIFPLSEAQSALAYQKQGHSRGKNVIVID